MSRVAYSAFGKSAGFTPTARYTRVPEAAPTIPVVDEVEDAYRRGFEDGQAAARADAEAQIAREREARAAIELAFARFDADSAEALRESLCATVHALCEEALVPLALETQSLTKRIEIAASMLQRKHDERVISIHPEDLKLVRDSVDPSLELVADASVERGGLRVDTDDGGIEDGPQKWKRALVEAFETCAH